MRASPEEVILDRPNLRELLDDGYEIGPVMLPCHFLVGFSFAQHLLDNRLVWLGSPDENTWGHEVTGEKKEVQGGNHGHPSTRVAKPPYHKRTAGQEIEGDPARSRGIL